MMQPFQPVQGFLVVDKPAGLTSRDAVDHVQRWFPRTKLGHAGTLDPAATGVLVVGIGAVATRFLEYVQDQEKLYATTIRLGATSTTDDGDGVITETLAAKQVDKEEVLLALQSFIGTITQTPPAYSAAKIDGERAHTKARRGEPVSLKPRSVTVHACSLQRYAYPELDLEIRCSKGTYIRSIARDLGVKLSVGGYVHRLRRTRIGTMTCELAVEWDANAEEAKNRMLPIAIAAEHLQKCQVDGEQTQRLKQGQGLKLDQGLVEGSVALWCDSEFFGIGRYEAGLVRPQKIIAEQA